MIIEMLKNYRAKKGGRVIFKKGVVGLVDKTTAEYLIKKKYAKKATIAVDDLAKHTPRPYIDEDGE